MSSRAGPGVGPLAPYAVGFGQALAAAGYAAGTGVAYGRRLGAFSGWLAAHGVAPGECTQEVVDRFVESRRRVGRRVGRRPGRWVGPRGLRPLLAYLRAEGLIPVARPPAPDAHAQVIEAFGRYGGRARWRR